LIARARRRNRARIGLHLGRDGESVNDWQVMANLDREGPKPQNELAEHIGHTPAGLSRLLDGLVRRGMVRREDDPRDGRLKVVTLTPKGRAWVKRLRPSVVQALYEVASSLTQREQLRLRQLLVKLTA
jgi:DNA-binding MarR family transcriptional regulator